MNESLVDTLFALCQQTTRVPFKTLVAKTGYHRNQVMRHLERLNTLGLVEKKGWGYWVPTFDGPYDYDTLYVRVRVHDELERRKAWRRQTDAE